ncbi:MAG: hypothetical protein K6F99_10325 [Lachnospiraceae bacterium]|nr:hypothetical protein [Lachnospiraceae bacterium]
MSEINRDLRKESLQSKSENLFEQQSDMMQRMDYSVKTQEKQLPFTGKRFISTFEKTEVEPIIYTLNDRIEVLRDMPGERPVFKVRELFGKNEMEKYKAELQAEKIGRLTDKQKKKLYQSKGVFMSLIKDRESILDDANYLKDTINGAKTDDDIEKVMNLRLNLSEKEMKVQQKFTVAMLEEGKRKEFLDKAALIRKLKRDLEIYNDAKNDGVDVKDRLEAVQEELKKQEAEIRETEEFKDYKAQYRKEYRGAKISPEYRPDREELLKSSDFETELSKKKEENDPVSELKKRNETLQNNKFKKQEDSSRMKAVKTNFNNLTKTILNPPGNYEEQKNAIKACYEQTKKACKKYIADHTDSKLFGWMRSKEGVERRKLVQEYLDRITFEEDNLFKNMEILLQKNSNATWADALQFTGQTTELHMDYLKSCEKAKSSKETKEGWDNVAGKSYIRNYNREEINRTIKDILSLPVSETVLKMEPKKRKKALVTAMDYVNFLKLFRYSDPDSETERLYQELPNTIKQELFCREMQLEALSETLRTLNSGEAAYRNRKEYDKELTGSRKKLKDTIKAGYASFNEAGVLNSKQMTSDKVKPVKVLIKNLTKGYYDSSNEFFREKTRTKNDYVLPMNASPEMVVKSKHQIENELNSTRSVVEKVVNRKVYERYDAKVKSGDEKERTIKMHHGLGTKLKNSGAQVINIDIAGSGFKEFRREQSAGHGKDNLKNVSKKDRELYDNIYGTRLGNEHHYLRVKGDLEKEGKVRYGISGVQSPKGLLNRGKYSIENQIDYAFDMMRDQLSFAIDKYLNNETDKLKPVYINLQSHSRGAIAASKAILRINSWLEEILKDKYSDFSSNYLKINMIQLDPVAGLGSNNGLNKNISLRNPELVTENKSGKKNYKGFSDPGVINATTVYTMFSDYRSSTFAPQLVRGQERIILKVERHNMGMDRVDASQLLVNGDGKVHRNKVVDGATMEGYRGSGYSELPAGVYVEDENGVLIRMRDLKEATGVMEGLKENIGNQKGRQGKLQEVVKNWFIDNEYVDDTMTVDEVRDMIFSENNLEEVEKLSDDIQALEENTSYKKMISSVTDSYTKVRDTFRKNPDITNASEKIREELIRQAKSVIDGCKSIMELGSIKDQKGVILTCSRALSSNRALLALMNGNIG